MPILYDLQVPAAVPAMAAAFSAAQNKQKQGYQLLGFPLTFSPAYKQLHN